MRDHVIPSKVEGSHIFIKRFVFREIPRYARNDTILYWIDFGGRKW